jgi:fructokinase
VVDTTGAGDGFTAGFLATLSRRLGSRAALARASLLEVLPCVEEGCRVGSQVVTALGATAGLPRERGQLRVPVAAVLRRPASPPP